MWFIKKTWSITILCNRKPIVAGDLDGPGSSVWNRHSPTIDTDKAKLVTMFYHYVNIYDEVE